MEARKLIEALKTAERLIFSCILYIWTFEGCRKQRFHTVGFRYRNILVTVHW